MPDKMSQHPGATRCAMFVHMGTWAAGPFGNDAALDFVGGLMNRLMEPVNEFMESPEIDETLDPAFAAIALMNAVMEKTPVRPWAEGGAVDPVPIREAMLRCFDADIGSLEPAEGFVKDQRAALVAELDRFVALANG